MPSDFSSLRIWMSPWILFMLPVQSWGYLQSINKWEKYPVNSPPWRLIYLQPLPDTHHPSEPSKVWIFKNILSSLYYFYLWEGYSSITIMRNRISPTIILNGEILMISQNSRLPVSSSHDTANFPSAFIILPVIYNLTFTHLLILTTYLREAPMHKFWKHASIDSSWHYLLSQLRNQTGMQIISSEPCKLGC